MSPSSRPLWRGRTLALVGIVLLAFSLRSGVASLSPILDHVADDFAVPAWVIGLIGTVPPVCFAVFGILTPQFERRVGLERLVVVALVVAALAMVRAGVRRGLADAAARHRAAVRGRRRGQRAAAAAREEVLPRSDRPAHGPVHHDDGGRDLPAAARRGADSGCRGLAPLARHVGRLRRRGARAVDRPDRPRSPQRGRRHRGRRARGLPAHVAAAARVGARRDVLGVVDHRLHLVRMAADDPRRHGRRDARDRRGAAVALRGDGASAVPPRACPRGALPHRPLAVRRRGRRRFRRRRRAAVRARKPRRGSGSRCSAYRRCCFRSCSCCSACAPAAPRHPSPSADSCRASATRSRRCSRSRSGCCTTRPTRGCSRCASSRASSPPRSRRASSWRRPHTIEDEWERRHGAWS